MKLLINQNRKLNKISEYNTQNENKVTELTLELPEEYSNWNKRIVFITDEGVFWDYIQDNTYLIKKNVTQYERVQFYIWLTNGEQDFRSEIGELSFNKNIEADDQIPTEEQIDGFNTLITTLNLEIEAVNNKETELNGIIADLQHKLDTGYFNGTNGSDGEDGESAYQIWIEQGNQGTEQDFLNSLKGHDGTNGVNGTNGQDGFSPVATVQETATGATISITDKNGTTTVQITNGQDGTNGTNGQDGYTPVRGVDYWTDEDITGIENHCDDYADEIIADLEEQVEDLQKNQLQGNESGTSIDLSDSADSRVKSITLNGNSVQNTSILPSEYQQVEYIESTGTQYIDTSIKPNQNIKFNITMKGNRKNQSEFILGSRIGFQNNNFGLSFQYDVSDATLDSIRLAWGNATLDYDASNTNIKTNINNFVIDAGKLYMNNTNICTITNNEFSNNNNIYLFTCNNNGSPHAQYSSYKLYSCQIYDGGNIVKNLIPCYRKSDNVIGLYDLVSKTFFTNAGTGTFNKGNDVTLPTVNYPQSIKSAGDNGSINEIISENLNGVILPEQYQQVEYIQSTGTQYIDTGIKTDVDIAMESVLKTTAASNELDYSGACYNGRLGWLLFGSYENGKLVCYFARDNRAGVEIKFDNNFHKYYLKNGLQKIDNVSNNNTITQMATDFNIYLFKGNVDFEANFVEKQIIKYFKIWKNETLVRDFIPCYRKSDGVIGFYDLVTRTFFTNAGTGTFIAGEEIIKQTYTIPCQQPMRSIGDVKDTFAKINGNWIERHNISRISSYNGEEITTAYMSTTGELSTGATVDYVLETPLDLPCTQAQTTALKSLQKARTYKKITHIYSEDEIPAEMDLTYYKDTETIINDLITRVEVLESEV